MVGFHDPKIQIRDPEFGCVSQGELSGTICNREDDVGALRIGPLLVHNNMREPTVIHACPRTQMSALLRTTMLKVRPDPDLQKQFASWWEKAVHEPFIKALDGEAIDVNVDDWLTKYPISYREKMKQTFNTVFFGESKFFEYEAFPKVELQYTEVEEFLKETPLNTVKERQICGPTDEKKMMANAFINAVEKFASKHIKGYCGDKNWPEIASTLGEEESKFHKPQWQAMDGSAFDTTVNEFTSRLVDKLLLDILNHPNCYLDPQLDASWIKSALEASYKLSISVGRGAVKYEALGRASGDGWTTFSNSMIMLALQKFCMFRAGIEGGFATAKGDDALCCVEEEDGVKFREQVAKVFAKANDETCTGTLGFIAKFVKFGDLTQLDFISNHFFINASGGYRLTRIPSRVIQTMPWSTRMPKNLSGDKALRVARELCYSKGSCLLAWSKGLPIWEVYARKLMNLGIKGKATEYNYYADEARQWGNFDDREAYMAYLSERFSLSHLDVECIEARIKGIRSLYDVVNIPELEAFYFDAY